MEIHSTRLNELFIDFYYYHVVTTPTTSSTPIRKYQSNRDWSEETSLNDYIDDDYSSDIRIEQENVHQESELVDIYCPERKEQVLETESVGETETDSESRAAESSGVLNNLTSCDIPRLSGTQLLQLSETQSYQLYYDIDKMRNRLKQATPNIREGILDIITDLNDTSVLLSRIRSTTQPKSLAPKAIQLKSPDKQNTYQSPITRRNICLHTRKNRVIRKQRQSGRKFQLLLRHRKPLSENDIEILKSFYEISAITRLKYYYKLTVINQTAYRILIEKGDIRLGCWPNIYAARIEPYKVGGHFFTATCTECKQFSNNVFHFHEMPTCSNCVDRYINKLISLETSFIYISTTFLVYFQLLCIKITILDCLFHISQILFYLYAK